MALFSKSIKISKGNLACFTFDKLALLLGMQWNSHDVGMNNIHSGYRLLLFDNKPIVPNRNQFDTH